MGKDTVVRSLSPLIIRLGGTGWSRVVVDDAHPGFEYIQTRGSMVTTHPILVAVTGERELCWNCGQIKTPQRLDWIFVSTTGLELSGLDK